MGTTYAVRYESPISIPGLAEDIDSCLNEINQSLSTYLPTALVAEINAGTDVERWYPLDVHFKTVFTRAQEVHQETGGAFSPAVGPLVSAWGFGPAPRDAAPDRARIEELLRVSDLNAFEVSVETASLRKLHPEAQLDFSGIAKGYAVDQVGLLLESRGIEDYMVEIGGEVRTRGAHPSGRAWRVGIERPVDSALEAGGIQTVVSLTDAGLATSGNYRNYYEEGGRRYAHILDPATGYPEMNGLLSATVVAADSMTADAYATAFMVMGLDDALSLVESRRDLDAYFISSGADGAFVETWTGGFGGLMAE